MATMFQAAGKGPRSPVARQPPHLGAVPSRFAHETVFPGGIALFFWGYLHGFSGENFVMKLHGYVIHTLQRTCTFL